MDCNLGTVGMVKDNWLIISRESFAPGIWAGSEGMCICFKQGELVILTTVHKVDLENRRLWVDLIEDMTVPFDIYHGIYAERLLSVRVML